MEAGLSNEKILRLQQLISANLDCKKCTKRELLSLIGSLSFANKVVVPGCPFLSRLIKLSCTVSQLDHHVYLNQGVREDLSSGHISCSTGMASLSLWRTIIQMLQICVCTLMLQGHTDMGHTFRDIGSGETGPLARNL